MLGFDGESQGSRSSALPVTGEDTEEPAELYLRAVRAEREALPFTISASGTWDAAAVPRQVSVAADPSWDKLPWKTWTVQFCKRFEIQRRKVQLESQLEEVQTRVENWEETLSTPRLSILRHIDQVSIREGIECLGMVFESLHFEDELNPLFPWLYGLLLRLETPVLADTQATLFSILKTLIARRERAEGDDEIAKLNIPIVILSKVFGQGRLRLRD